MSEESSLFEKFKETGKHGFVFGLGATLQRLIALILLPIYTTYLTTSEYGVWGLLSITGQMMGIVFSLHIVPALFRSYFDYHDDDNRKSVVSTALFLIVISCFILLIIGFLVSDYLSILIFGNKKYNMLILLIIVVTIFRNLHRVPFAVLRVQKESIQYTIFQLLFLLVGIAIIIYLVTIKNLGVLGIVFGHLIAALLLFLFLFPYVRKNLVLKFSRFEAKRMIHYGAPLVLAGISGFVFTYADRYLINYFLTLSEVGIYTLGYQIGMVMTVILINPTKLIWGPMFLSVKEHSNFSDFCSKALTYVILIGAFLFLILSLLSKEVIQIISNEEYWRAYKIVPLIALTYFIWSSRPILEVGIALKRKTKITAWYFFIGATINVILNLFLIPLYGIMGAAFATLFAFSLMIAIDYYYNRKYYRIDYEWTRILKICIITALIFTIGYTTVISNLYFSVLFKICIILSFPLILYLASFYTKNELEGLKEIFRLILSKLKINKCE